MENYNDKEEELILREPIAAYGKKVFSIEEYLEFENASEERHEYYKGEIFPMAVATMDHCAISRNMLVGLANGLENSSLEPLGSNFRLHIPSNTLFTYADIIVASRDAFAKSETGATLPTVIVEILLKESHNYDRGKKFELYKDIPSFQEYVLVDSQRLVVDIYRKEAENRWVLQRYTLNDRSIEIRSLDVSISFNKIYTGVEFNDYNGYPVQYEDDFEIREPIVVNGKKTFTIEEYLEFEEASLEKHEYYGGEIFAMAGASEDHCNITGNLFNILKNTLKKSPCKPWINDLKLHIQSNESFTYPDIRVSCREKISSSETGSAMPKVIIEVLSKSTRKYDRGKKFELYKDISSFQEYILVDSQKLQIDIYRKTTENIWELQKYAIRDESIEIKSLNLKISFNEIYEDVQFNDKDGFPILSSVKEKVKRA